KALAAVGLWRLGNPVLLDLVRDAEQLDDRLAFLHALGMTGKDAQTKRLLQVALRSPHVAERRVACLGLARVAETEDIAAVVQSALVRCYQSEVPRVKANAVLPLWRSGYAIVLKGVKEMLSSTQGCVRASAAWALGRVGGIVARSYLERALDDSDDTVRKLA